MQYTVIITPRCPVMLNPTHDTEQADEMMLGWRAEILEETTPGWYKIRADYRYEGYAPAECLNFNEEQVNAFLSLPKNVITKMYCTVMSIPDVQGALVTDLPRGALVAPLSEADEKGWVKVALPDSREGYTKASYLGTYHETCPFNEDEFRQAVCDTAITYMGAHYRWGGKSPLGIDCSGLTFMAYWLNGVSIYRDARILPDFPVREIAYEEIKKGDLIFFPGHVGLYLGEGRYIHSTGKSGSDGVVINSFDPSAPDYREEMFERITSCGTIF